MITRRVIAVIGSLVLLLPMIATWPHPSVTWGLKCLTAGLFAAAVASPLIGLCGLIVALPLATPWQVFYAPALPSGAQASEIMLLPFLGGACLRLAFDREPVRSRLAVPAVVLGAAFVASGVWRLYLQQLVSTFPADFVRDLWTHLRLYYFTDPERYGALHAVTAWIEALVLSVTAERVLRRHPSAARAVLGLLVFSGVEMSALAVNRFFQVVVRRGGTFAAAWELFTSRPRINPQWANDPNAAGSYYALIATPAIWLALRKRWWVIVALPPLLLALWFAGSRSALASVVIGLLVAWTLSRPNISWPRVAVVFGAAIALAIYAAWKSGDVQMPAEAALSYRQEFASIALRMARDNPWFGVGVTEFKHATIAYLRADHLEILAPFGGENAHNNFLQILGELGLTGFLAFMWLLARPAVDLWRAARARAATLPIAALAAGVIAFLLSCLGGHPLLITQVLFAFFLVFGIFAGTLPQRPPSAPGARAARWIVATALILFVITLPFRLIDARRTLTLPNLFLGASELHDSVDGLVYRIAEPQSTWFVLAKAQRVDIPLRWTAPPAAPCSVSISVDGRVVNEVSPRADMWLHTTFEMSGVATRNTTRRFDLVVRGSGCTLMVAPLVTHD